MFPSTYRDHTWSHLDQPWDIIVIGGGITGAGILREAARLGLRGLLLEQRDFAWGTSSRSSKLVHGGLRYLKQGQVLLTRASVQERERLLDEGPGLIDPLGFLLATYKGDRPGRRMYQAGLSIYDLLALQWSHRYYKAADFQLLAPHITGEALQGGFHYGDAQTDDARLVLRVIQEAVADGAAALNYAAVEGLLHAPAGDLGQRGPVVGVRVVDRSQPHGQTAEVRARVVINATGTWADRLRGQAGPEPVAEHRQDLEERHESATNHANAHETKGQIRGIRGKKARDTSAPGTLAPRIRPLRGSHLIFPAWRLPVAQALSFLHPVDRRPVFIFPWEGITLVGTTDVDHEQPLDEEPRIGPAETAYLMAAVEAQFPSLNLTLEDVIATFAGVRPVIGSGKADPSEEARDHVIWHENGLLTVTGGKLTTFRRIALDVLKVVHNRLPELPEPDDKVPVLNQVDVRLSRDGALDEASRRRLLGRYAAEAPALVAAARAGELTSVENTQTLWAELRWAARNEAVLHLDDLLLRRTRLGLLLSDGGETVLPMVEAICREELGWDAARWGTEETAYRELWRKCYSPPDPASVPDWRAMLAEARARRQAARQKRRRRLIRSTEVGGVLLGLALLVGGSWLLRRRLRCN